MNLPQISILPTAIKRVRNFDGWVFRDEVTHTIPSLEPGTVVSVIGRDGSFVALAFYHPQAPIALRIASLDPHEAIDAAWLRGRLERAISRRAAIPDTNAKRLVFSEADGLPGLIVDQYDTILVVQCRSAGMDRLRGQVVEALQELVHPRGILERSDKEFRTEEGLPPVTQVLYGKIPERVQIQEAGVRFLVDPHRGLKTGFYLDQRTTRARLPHLIHPNQRFLDAFTYTGSLGIVAAKHGARVTCVEQNETFIALAKENATLNKVADRIEWIAGDAFYWLEAATQSSTRFDWVSLDPPSLTKTKEGVHRARQALHHLLINGFRLTAPGGQTLVSLCTYHLLGVAEEIVRIAAGSCERRCAVRDVWMQAEDHPWILQIPVTRYLMTWRLGLDAQ